MEGENPERYHDVMELLRAIAVSQQRLEALLSQPEALEVQSRHHLAHNHSHWQWPAIGQDNQHAVAKDDRDEDKRDVACAGESSYAPSVVNTSLTLDDITQSEGMLRLQSAGSRHSAKCDLSRTVGSHRLPIGVVHPDSSLLAFVDICTMLALSLELVLIPYQIAWQAHGAPHFVTVNRVLLAFWVVDLLLGFNVGFYKKGEVVLDRSRIAKRYMRTMFFPNLLAVGADLASALLTLYSVGAPRWAGVIPRILKVERMVCLLARLRKWRLTDRLESVFRKVGFHHQALATKRVVELVVVILWLNHLGACLWRVVGKSVTDEWAQEQFDVPLSHDDLLSYLCSYLWSTQAMISGGLLIFPKTSGQVLVSIVVIQVGVMLCSIIVGILADTLLELRARNKEWMEERGKMRFYMEQGNVPSSFTMSLEEEILEARDRNSQHVDEAEVNLLQCLSQPSRDKLRELVFGHVIASEAFVRSCVALHPLVVKHVCTNCISRSVLLSGQTAFEANKPAEGAYLALWGSFEYIPSRPCTRVEARRNGRYEDEPRLSFASAGSSMGDAEWCQPSCVENVTWLCQLALFCSVTHSGSMVASARGEYLRIDGDKFRQVVHNTPKLAEVAMHYRKAIVDAFKRHPDEKPCDISPAVGHVQILSMMPAKTRAKLSRAGLILTGQSAGLFGGMKGFHALQEEVEAGKCDLVVEAKFVAWNEPPKEVVRRVAAVAILRLARHDGRLLAQIGKLKDGRIQPQVELPGKKVKSGEFPVDTLAGILENVLPSDMKEQAHIRKHDLVQQVKPSSSYSVETRYFRHVFHADFDADADASFAATCMRLRAPSDQEQAASKDASVELGLFESTGAFLLRHEEAAPAVFAWLPPQDLDDPRRLATVEAAAAHYTTPL